MRAPARWLLAAALAALPAVAVAGTIPPQLAGSAEAMRQRYEVYQDRLARNAWGRPVEVASQEGDREVRGHVHAEVRHAFARVAGALERNAEWCSILILPIQTKGCTATISGDRLTVFVGPKAMVLPDDAFRIDFRFKVTQRTPQYLRLELEAPQGPMGTRDYHIVLEAAPIDERRTFLHFAYDTGYGPMSRTAMKAYLATVGAGKVGFSMVEEAPGRPGFVRGMRGVVERNTMRYYLAIEAYLDSLDTPVVERDRRRQVEWFAATMRYPRQLEEMKLEDYLEAKGREVRKMRG